MTNYDYIDYGLTDEEALEILSHIKSCSFDDVTKKIEFFSYLNGPLNKYSFSANEPKKALKYLGNDFEILNHCGNAAQNRVENARYWTIMKSLFGETWEKDKKEYEKQKISQRLLNG